MPHRREIVTGGKPETMPTVTCRPPIIQTEVVRIGSDVPAVRAVHVESFRVRVSDVRGKSMEVACGQGDLEAVVVGRHAVRKAKDSVNVRVLRGILFGVDNSSSEYTTTAVAIARCPCIVAELSKGLACIRSGSDHCIPDLACIGLVVFVAAEQLNAVVAHIGYV